MSNMDTNDLFNHESRRPSLIQVNSGRSGQEGIARRSRRAKPWGTAFWPNELDFHE
jgi:hypothetical protein